MYPNGPWGWRVRGRVVILATRFVFSRCVRCARLLTTALSLHSSEYFGVS